MAERPYLAVLAAGDGLGEVTVRVMDAWRDKAKVRWTEGPGKDNPHGCFYVHLSALRFHDAEVGDALAVHCPYCDAPPGHWCVGGVSSEGGRLVRRQPKRRFHVARLP